MGYKRDQNYNGETFRRTSIAPEDVASELPPPYTEEEQSTSKDVPALPPRQSAAVTPSSDESRRKLLLIYVHGFTGNETSFQSFPTDVHDLTSKRLVDAYTVQSIVYPKYKSRKKIDFARDEFSNWLREYESSRTDVILLGHSMGGLLAAEVALLPLNHDSRIPLRHRILGTINLDVPFLGIHPGIVASGITSFFRKATDQLEEAKSSSQAPVTTSSPSEDVSDRSALSAAQIGDTSVSNTATSSSTVAPSIGSLSIGSPDNSSRPPEAMDSKQSKLSRALYFVNKHSDGLTKATKSYLTSHIEFGSCLADYKGLMTRYSAVRALDDNPQARVRFINYYTASTGHIKKSRPPDSTHNRAQPIAPEDRRPSTQQDNRDSALDTNLQDTSPRASNGGCDRGNTDSSVVTSEDISDNEPTDLGGESMTEIPDPSLANLTNPPTREPPEITSFSTAFATKDEATMSSSLLSADLLPPLPDPPAKPPSLDRSLYLDKDALKLASRDHDRALKTYNRLLKDRDKAIKDRRKLLDKRAKAAGKEARDGGRKAAKQNARPNEKGPSPLALNDDHGDGVEKAISEPQPNPDTCPPSINKPSSSAAVRSLKPLKPSKQPKPPKYRPFCLLPHQHDPTWVRIVMRDTDEIDAHCGLFDREGEHYEGFVKAVVERIAIWIEEAPLSNHVVP
ncbi:MAG: hypothetical protein Q9205_001095 [Flavoplaca limonia]